MVYIICVLYIQKKINRHEKTLIDLYNTVPTLVKDHENNVERLTYLENSLDDIESKVDSLKIITNIHEDKIKLLESKSEDYNIADIFKGTGDNISMGNISVDVIKTLENKFDSKIKLNNEKIIKLEESNFKVVRQVQNVRNSHDLFKRNIDSIKASIEEMDNKNENLNKKIDMNYDDLIEKLDNKEKSIKKLINETFDYISKNGISIENKSIQSENSLSKNDEKLSGDMNNILNKNKIFLNALQKIKEVEDGIKNMSETLGIEQMKLDIHGLKSGINNYCTLVDFKELKEKTEEILKQIKFNKEQFEDYINDKTDHEEIQTLKRKLELEVNKSHEIETVLIELIKKIDENSTKSQDTNFKNSKYLESKTFEEFKTQILKEFSNINENFMQSKKITDEIIESLKNRTCFKDLKVLEDVVLGKIEELKISSSKKFADHNDTYKTFKYFEQQIKNITQIFLKKMDNSDSAWILAKKPMNTICASCESYIGELKDSGTYIPWNKYPNKDPNDKLYRLGNGYSKMLQMIQIDENEKKNINGYQTYTDFNDVIKQIHNPLKTEGNNNILSSRARGLGLPKIKDKKKVRQSSENSNSNDLVKINNLNINGEESEEEGNQPKITKIYRMTKEGKDKDNNNA